MLYNLSQMKAFLGKKKLIIFLTIGLALFLRAYHWSSYPFGFDQVLILENAAKIKAGKLTLIGPETGPAPIFTGPLMYYLTALLMFFIPSPYTVVASALTISLITGFLLYYLTQKYLKPSLSLITYGLWVVSPFLISLDRMSWVPNLSFLAAILVFFPLLGAIKNRLSFAELLIVAAGVFLGYQAHFSGLLLLPLVLLTAFIFLKRRFGLLLVSTLAFCLSLLPTLIFDLRHQWLNLNGLLSFLRSGQSINLSIILSRVLKNIYITIENLGKILFFNNNHLFVMFTGGLIFFFTLALLQAKNKRPQIIFALFWAVAIAVFFGPYSGSTPEYYFIIQFPALLCLISILLEKILSSKLKKTVAFTVFACYTILLINNIYRSPGGLNLGNQVKATNYLKKLSETTPIKKFNYAMEYVYFPGFQYLLKDIKLDSQGREVVIIYPYMGDNLLTAKLFPIGIWLDPRVEQDKNYLTMSDFLISTPEDIFLYQDHYRKGHLESSQAFIINRNQRNLGSLFVFPPKISNKFLPILNAQNTTTSALVSPWSNLTIQSVEGYAFTCNHKLFFFTPSNEGERPELLSFLKDVQVVAVGSENCADNYQ